jgi:asparagine synthase (glutamine-hydrolysing)
VARFVALGVHPSARKGDTFFKGVKALPPASNATIAQNGWQQARYYRVSIDCDTTRPEDHVVERFRELLIDSVRLRLNADVRVGSGLSGGLDSSSIVAAIDYLLRDRGHSACDGRQLTFSSVFTESAPYNERPFVDAVLGHIPAHGVLVFPTADDLKFHIEEVVRCQDEPFGDLSIFAQWCVMRAVKGHGVGVLLDGQGADEVLGGYSPFTTNLAELLSRGKPAGAIRELRALRSAGHSGVGRMALGAVIRQLPRAAQGALGRGRRRDTTGLSMLAPDLRRNHAILAEEGVDEDQTSLSELLRYQMEEGVLPALLRYEDRNSSAFGLESRVPFLDHRLVDLAFTEGMALRLRDGWTKWILREAFQNLLPAEVIWRRRKVGFGVPGAEWVRRLLRTGTGHFFAPSPAEQYLDLPRLRGIGFTPNADDSQAVSIWRCINLEVLLKCREWHAGSQVTGYITVPNEAPLTRGTG